MSIKSKDKLSWNDIKNLYTLLNENYKKFSIPVVKIPEQYKKKVVPNDVQTLNTYVTNMTSNKYIKNVANTGVVIPETKTLIYPLEFGKIKTTLENINKVCPHDNSFYTSNNGFNPDFDAPSCSTQCGTYCSSDKSSFYEYTGFDNKFAT